MSETQFYYLPYIYIFVIIYNLFIYYIFYIDFY